MQSEIVDRPLTDLRLTLSRSRIGPKPTSNSPRSTLTRPPRSRPERSEFAPGRRPPDRCLINERIPRRQDRVGIVLCCTMSGKVSSWQMDRKFSGNPKFVETWAFPWKLEPVKTSEVGTFAPLAPPVSKDIADSTFRQLQDLGAVWGGCRWKLGTPWGVEFGRM